MDGTIEAKVYRVIPEPYSDNELASMDEAKRRHVKLDKVEKIIAEEQLADIQTRHRNELKNRVIELCIQQAPYPIVVKLANNDTLDRTYIVDKRFRANDPEAIWENIIFGYNQKGKEILKLITDNLLDMNRKIETGVGPSSESEDVHTRLDSLYAELERRFGIKLSEEPISLNAPYEIYRTTQEAAITTPLNITTLSFQNIQEVVRLITKGRRHRVNYGEYLGRILGDKEALSLVAGSILNTEIPPADNRWAFAQDGSPPPRARLL